MFKKENGFSLVELAIAAGLAVALAATAVVILSGTTATLSTNASGAAETSTIYNSRVLNDGGTSNNAPAIQPPVSPAGFIAGSITSSTAALTWDSVENATSYQVLVDGVVKETLNAGTTSYTVPELRGDTTYNIDVVAVNDGGTSPAASVTVTTLPAATMTQLMNFQAVNDAVFTPTWEVVSQSITLSWNQVNGAASYRVIYTDSVSGASETVTIVDGGPYTGKKISYTIALGAKFNAAYSVAAVNSDGVAGPASSQTMSAL